jgi:hypothetical protein
MLRYPPKIVGLLCTVQTVTVVSAFLVARAMLKVYNAAIVPVWGEMPWRFHWPLKVMLGIGPWLLLVPAVWGLVATLKADVEGRVAEITDFQSKLGYGITIAMILFCILASFNAMGLAFNPVKLRILANEG